MKPLVILLVLLVACREATAPNIELLGAVQIQPPANYLTIWNETEACSGLVGDFGAVTFYIVQGDTFMIEGETYRGVWIRNGNRIVLASDWARVPQIIMHEEMHALLQGDGHPAHYFNGVCGNLM